MNMKDFRQRVLEQQIFDELKDTSIKSSEYFRKKYNGADIDCTRLYRRIVNYQIKEYGTTLNFHVPKKTKEDLLNEHRKARQRKYERKSRRYENNNFIKWY